MRLNDFSKNIRVRDQRGMGGTGGKLGCGAVVIAILGAVVFGIDPMTTLGVVDQVQQTQGGSPQASGRTVEESCNVNAYSLETCSALSSLDETWAPLFAEAGIRFEQPTLNFYDGRGQSGCGAAQAAMGPFYCPSDQGIYIDTSFYDQLDQQLGAGGDFARAYVIGHEYGHHIQTLTGTSNMVRQAQQQNRSQANQLQVRMELQADCYAGVWAAKNPQLIEPGDIEEGLRAASAIGDDALTQGRVSPDNFTHGTSQQRMQWLQKGLRTGDEDQCDTFADLRG
ncbi:neutral zinc metallopeptidase [Croceicoccus gelatinilyticus]|uniref:KPN_02809 family neutral zinc metallopeptidase n=1 Tax=Croceicoccus gelatinilyticus TaxID=2835536 RepID=UPI001BCD8E42|nr:neutral zinc metallopeptidase [Croceicoccus gelatinilyticus]MBS7670465.1 neutral zinc metallopeptidase [Croceicoccus gelatinilyticus]